ncbi:MAG: sigma-54-dependent Fis family transcriptional regulator [SAR324 cluster bacterium]|nr:sigma-54-dependent Fis family transcriptional regulator [SAR324 cluster bacterium]
MNILLIDDQPNMGEMFGKILKALHHQVTYLSSGPSALALSDEELDEFDLIFIDMAMPGMDGCQTGIAIKKRMPDMVNIMLTADSSIDTVIQALRDSKFDDYLCKADVAKDAFKGSFKLQETLMRAHTLLKTRHELRNTQNALSNEYNLNQVLRKQSLSANKQLLGESPAFQRVLQLVKKVAASDTTVLIQGETGTGKELVARAVHKQSLRANAPFVPVNCGAIPRDLLESELFGHKKGSFTGASSDREGLFQLADHGTLFLDEIGDMPLDLQVKLLRVLQDREVLPVGGTKPIKVDVRVISATHQNLQKSIKEKRFREDLFYRLNVFPIFIPPLRERTSDLPVMIDHFISKNGNYTHVKGITPEALQRLQNLPWKGNVRELENVVERAMLVTVNEYLTKEDFMELTPVSESVEIPVVLKSTPEVPPIKGYEKLWDCFVKNECKLWIFENHDVVKKEMEALLEGAVYQKKGHFGQLVLPSDVQMEVGLQYVNASSYEVEKHSIVFQFFSSKNSLEKTGRPSSQNTQKIDPYTTSQLVLKGLPDTYIFDILYQPAKRNELSLISQQQLIRTLILRYAQVYAPGKSLKEIFKEVMVFLIDENMVNRIDNLEKDGLEAVRACLCSKSHIFPGIASQLKVHPQRIESEIQKVFPHYVCPV